MLFVFIYFFMRASDVTPSNVMEIKMMSPNQTVVTLVRTVMYRAINH